MKILLDSPPTQFDLYHDHLIHHLAIAVIGFLIAAMVGDKKSRGEFFKDAILWTVGLTAIYWLAIGIAHWVS